MSNQSSIRWFVNRAALSLMMTQCAMHAAWAGDINRVVQVDISSQPLAAALTTLAKQSDLHILFTPTIVDGLQAVPLSGSYSASQALRALLANTQLEFVMEGEDTIVVRERKPMASTSTAAAPVEEAAAGIPPDDRSGSELQEIIVTAARISESLQKTALAIQTFSSEDITERGAVTPEEVGKLVPGMNITASGMTTIYLRGLGANGAGGFGQNSLSFNVDGITLAQQGAVNGNFFDLERVEVLKGPQGTLYGRNASSGAINLITKDPGRELGGNLNVEVGNYSLRRVTTALDVPFSDTFALRGALYASERDGYNDDGTDDDDQLNGRLKALWTPSDSLRVLLAYSESSVHTRGGNGGGQVARPPLNGEVRLGLTNPQVSDLLTSLGTPIPNPRANSDVNNHMAYATVDWDLGFGTLTYIPAYVWGKECLACAASIVPDPSVLGTHLDTEQLSNELRLAHVGDRFKYVAGLYQFSEHVEMDNVLYINSFSGSATQRISKLDTDSYAAFGEVTYSLTDTFRMIGGLRYTRDEKELAGLVIAAGPLYRDFGLGPDPIGIGDGIGPGITTGIHEWTVDNSGAFSRTNWKVGVEYDLSPTSFLFATVGTGFKSGIFYPGPAPGNLAEPEYMTAYTVGSKNRFLDNSLQVNAEIFYWDFENQQVTAIGIDSAGSLNAVTYNAGASTIYGASVDMQWRITPSDLLRVNVEYDHAYYDEYFIPSPLPFGADGIAGGCPISSAPGGPFGTMYTADCSGKHMVFAPDWSGNVAYGHDFAVGAGNTLHAEVSARFNSEQYLQQNWATERSRMDAYVMWDALLEYSFADRPVSVALWGRNLSDEVVYTSADGSTVPGVYLTNLQAPRTYGVRLNVSF